MQGLGRRMRVECLKYAGGFTPATAPTVWYAALSTAVIADDASGLAEPTSTGGYTPPNLTWTTPPTPTAGNPAVLANSATQNWGASSAAWSTGATTLPVVGIFNNITTRTEAVFIGAMGVSVARAVNAAGITLESQAGDLQFTLTPT